MKFSNYCKFVDGTTFYRLLSVKSCVRGTDFVYSYINMFICRDYFVCTNIQKYDIYHFKVTINK